MALRYFKTKREAERAALKLVRTKVVIGISLKKAHLGRGYIVLTDLPQAELDDILSRPMPRRKKEGK